MLILRNYRFKAIISAILLYGFLSQPTPEVVTWVELAILALIIISVNIKSSILRTLTSVQKTSFESISIVTFLIWPFLGLIYFQNDVHQSIRDLIAALFMIMFCFGLPKMSGRTYDFIMRIVFVAGYSFIIRDIFLVREHISDLGSRNLITNQTYLLQDTIVLFAVLYAILNLSRKLKEMNFSMLMFYIILIVLGQLAFLAQGLRLNVIISLGYLGFSLVTSRGKYARVLALVFLCLVIYVVQRNMNFFEFIIEKFLNVGTNGKVDEFKEVGLLVFGNWDILLLGKGFGGEFFSPTYNSQMNFTHSLFSYLLLKMGLIGFFYGIFVYLFWMYCGIMSIIRKNEDLQILLLSLAPPLLTQPTYKSFGCGIIIWMVVSMIKQQKIRKPN